MRSALKALPQMALMAAIVATLACVPLGAALALLASLFGTAPSVLVTFGDAVDTALGLLLWWLLAFAAACGYAAWLFPWGDKDFGQPGAGA